MEKKDLIITGNIADIIGKDTERLIKATDRSLPPEGEAPKPYDLYAYSEGLMELGGEILPDSIAESKLSELKKELYKLKKRYPEGTEVMLAAFPCNSNGYIYTDEDIKNGRHFVILFVNAEQGLATGYGSMPGTQYKILPVEIQEKCKFKVHYRSEEPGAEQNDEKDFEDFSALFLDKYRELQNQMKH